MADIATRGNAGGTLQATNPLLTGLLGFDPFRDFFPTWQQVSGVDVQRTEKGYIVEVPVPGFRTEEINITVEESRLTVAGESERRKFTRTLVLPEEIDTDNIEAKVENGLLTLALNLNPKAQPKKVQIRQANGH